MSSIFVMCLEQVNYCTFDSTSVKTQEKPQCCVEIENLLSFF